ncbi:hypothetical protein [uncultured Mucilaginibacter sp.]|uniref:hypothetical protein n=1 Tax=uncultured Mucilaginibacter sp. TaxID=797541 RepID=UPI0025D6EBA9|nr:hypothetical protein [uncultured Mucilaginibacter sp.]
MEPLVNQDNGKTVGIVSYLTFIGWLIAYFGMHQSNKTSLGSYQLRQTLLLHIISTGLWILMTFVFGAMFFVGGFWALYYLYRLLELALFVLWIIGLIGAINAEEKPIPLIGKMAQGMFAGI